MHMINFRLCDCCGLVWVDFTHIPEDYIAFNWDNAPMMQLLRMWINVAPDNTGSPWIRLTEGL